MRGVQWYWEFSNQAKNIVDTLHHSSEDDLQKQLVDQELASNGGWRLRARLLGEAVVSGWADLLETKSKS